MIVVEIFFEKSYENLWLFIYLFICAVINQKNVEKMKKQLLSILVMAAVAVGIIAGVSSCKKEEVKPATTSVTQQDPVDWVTKSGDWEKIKEGVVIEGELCDVYQNLSTNQIVYVSTGKLVNTNLKAASGLRWYLKKYTEAGHVDCKNSKPYDCWKGTIGGEDVIVLKEKK